MRTSRARTGVALLAVAVVAGACTGGGTRATGSGAPGSGTSVGTSAAAGSPGAPGGSGALAGPIDCVTGTITAAGSTALQPLVDAAGKAYGAACPGATISVQGGGSGTGLSQVASGSVDIGDSDITTADKPDLQDAASLVDHVVVQQGFIQVINRGVIGVGNLSTQQTIDIWTGKITNWKDLGGPDQAIVLVLRPQSSGTRTTFRKLVLGGAEEAAGQALTEDSSGAVATAVSVTPGAISVIGFTYYKANEAKLGGLALDSVEANVDNMINGTYKVAAPGHMYTKGEPTGLAKAFLDYMLSPAIQDHLAPSMFYAPAAAGKG
jgi:phosphate transport system substrate-binding protein